MTLKEYFANEIEELFDKKINYNNLSVDQINVIFEGLIMNIDTIDLCENGKYSPDQMEEIIDGMRQGIDVSYFLSPDYNYKQMHVIKTALLNEVNVVYLLSPDFEWDQMYQILLGLLNGVEVRHYNDPSISVTNMIKIRKELQKRIAWD